MFTKSFPLEVNGTTYWKEISLRPYEEKLVEKEAREENVSLLLECLRDAKEVMDKAHFKYSQTQRLNIALALFHKRCSHVVYKKEEKCREIFERLNSSAQRD
ncbi:hypothetical protein D6774_02100 [Candidatus Woesearchaeota archaeon]|nr:MAG: hypothetical protein D6774_02100 [Candidatus Woesearchaeota archaeon]